MTPVGGVAMRAAPEAPEIWLSGVVGGDAFGEAGFDAGAVIDALAGLGDVTVRINSGGGSAFEGAAIHAALRAHPGRVTVRVEGIAASAASLIAMAGDRIIMAEGAMMMIHDPSGMTFGPASVHGKAAADLEKLATNYAAVYAARTGKSVEEVRSLMLAETWMTAEEAVALGFADEAIAPSDRPVMVAAYAYGNYRRAPEVLRSLATAQGWQSRRPEMGQEGTDTMPDDQTLAAEAENEDTAVTLDAAGEARRRAVVRRFGAQITAAQADDVAMRARDAGEALTLAADMVISARMVAEGGEIRPSASVGRDWTAGPDYRAKMADGFAARIDRQYTPTMGREFAASTLPEMAMAVCRNAGLRPFNPAEAVRMAAHSTSDFPLILEGALSNVVARGFDSALPALARVSREVPRMDYRAAKSLTLSASGTPQEIHEGGEIQFVTADEKGEALPTPRDFGAGFNLTNKALANDDLGMIGQMADKMRRGAIETLRTVLLQPLLANSGAGMTMADGQTMFHSSHGNVAASGATISDTTVSNARKAMRLQRGLQGELYAVEPWGIVVSPERETEAQRFVAALSATKTADVNPFSGTLEVIVEPGLGTSPAWYLVGDPARFDGLAHAFLDGQRVPRVESRPAWSTLGLELRLVWAVDAKFIETASWYRNAGA